jgi:putative toxin-antitoxin system antitoxin component (TIGR02293 family)
MSKTVNKLGEVKIMKGKGTWTTKGKQTGAVKGSATLVTRASKTRAFKQGSYASRTRTIISEKKEGIVYLDTALTGLFSLSADDKIQYIKKGISKNELKNIKEEINLDYDALSKILSVSRATLLTKKPTQKFDQSTSEKIMLLADIVSYGLNVFEDKERFNDWLKRPNKALGEQSPLEKMDTVYGIQEVKNEIGRIEYGVY